MEHYQQSPKREVNKLPYEFPSQLEQAIADFVELYDYRHYRKALGNVAPADVLCGKGDNIRRRRKEVQIQTFSHRKGYNRDLKEPANIA